MSRPKLTMKEWKAMHRVAQEMAKKHARGDKRPLDQGEFVNAMHKALTGDLAQKIFTHGPPPAVDEMRKRDDGVIAQIEEPNKGGE